MTTEATNTGEEQALDTTGAAATGAVEGVASEAVVAGTEAAAAAETEATSTLVRPDGLDDKFWDDATGLKVGDLVSELRELQAKAAERAEGVPAGEETYDLALPEGFEVPEGLAVEFDKDDPLWTKVAEIGKADGMTKATHGKLLAAFAEYQIAEQKAQVDAYVAEKTALGANAGARIAAAEAYLKANLPTKQAEALGGALITADGVQALEALIKLKSGPVAVTGAGATNVNKFEGLHGAARLEAIRAAQAA